DTATDRLRYAVLPGRELSVLPAAGDGLGDGDVAATDAAMPGVRTLDSDAQPALGTGRDAGAWPWVAGLLGLGWLLTAGALGWTLWRHRRRAVVPTAAAGPPVGAGESGAWKQVQAACAAGAPAPAREALRRWLCTLPAPACHRSLLEYAADQPDTALAQALASLDEALYGPAEKAQAWSGGDLLAAARAARQRCLAGSLGASAQQVASLPPLYPSR
ncbi:MAG: hypothetical protein RIC38_05495, partial [Chromatocurvus sp.]